MLIGIDASRALRAQRTGTENYSLEIIHHLLTLPEAVQHQWRLYVDRPIPKNLSLLPPTAYKLLQNPVTRSEVRILEAQRLWTHLSLAHEVLHHPPDVLFIPAHVLPFVVPIKQLPASVVTIHDLGYHFFPNFHTWQQRAYLKISTRWNAFAATKLIAISQATASDLEKVYTVAPQKIQVIHEGTKALTLPHANIQTGMTTVLRKFNLPRPFALYLGTIQPRKNLARLLQAYAQISAQVDWDLVLAGKPGWLSSSLYESARTLNVEDRVHFTGYVADEEGALLMRMAKFFCWPSLFEGFGLPILEAQTAGVAVMTSNSSSIPEVAGEGALLVDPNDTDAIAQAMLQISQDEALRQRLIAAGYENVKRFSWEKAARETLRVLEEAAKSRQGDKVTG